MNNGGNQKKNRLENWGIVLFVCSIISAIVVWISLKGWVGGIFAVEILVTGILAKTVLDTIGETWGNIIRLRYETHCNYLELSKKIDGLKSLIRSDEQAGKK